MSPDQRGESAGLHLLRDELACPNCGNDVLEAVSDGTQTNFLCHRCWSCWHAELGYMEAVPVSTCPGCLPAQKPWHAKCRLPRPPERGHRP